MLTSESVVPTHALTQLHDLTDALDPSLEALLPQSTTFPDLLHRAMHYAVLSGGKRIRPRLLLAVYAACGGTMAGRPLALRAACAIEYVHAGSLVHDDLPCFDDARHRRGKPSTHIEFGEAMAVLVGDALLSRAFEVIADSPAELGARALRIISLLGATTGSSSGIIGGQSIEQQLSPALISTLAASHLPVDILERYHSMKTAALFRLATQAGAVAAGARDIAAWAEIGEHLGLAYQLSIDLDRRTALSINEEQRVQRLLGHAQKRSAALVQDRAPLTSIISELDRRTCPAPSLRRVAIGDQPPPTRDDRAITAS